MLSPKQREALSLVADGKFLPALVKEDDGWHARWRAIGVVDESVDGWVDDYVREANITRLSEDAEDQKHETLHDAWILALRSRTGLVIWDDSECAAFAAELETWSGNADEDVEARRSLLFSLQTGGTQASPSFFVSCAEPKGRRALKALGQSAYVWSPLMGLRSAPHSYLRVELTQTEAEDFLRCGARNLRDAGYGVEGVNLAAPLTATAEISAPSSLSLTIRLDGEIVTADEIRFLLDQGSTLVFFRDRWIEVDRGILKEALRALEKGAGKKANVLSFALGIGHIGSLAVDSVKTHGWLRGLVNELRGMRDELGGTRDEGRGMRDGFKGELRDYQKIGVEWLSFLTSHGFGALLADDMGLGKTIQVIAWILTNKNEIAAKGECKTPILIVAPLTLLSNWKHEFAKFAPSLAVYVHQGEKRSVASGFLRSTKAADVTLTSYNLLVRDYSEFSEVAWSAIVLDEAQAVKNPDTQVARAIRALMPPVRIALTGTPVENSVADIWALEDFLNPGFLGDRKTFTERFVKPIALDAFCKPAKRLQYALEPFILRRLKSDRRIAAELGEKREIREYCELTPAQRRAYEGVLADFRAREHAQGDVFALLTQLKLICDGEGKFERLAELLETIFANGESALIFTQYAKVGMTVRNELMKRFGKKFPFLHGALSVKAREEEIVRFNRRGPSAFILSLKAGGFGLNLTKATHIIHFDRWWNPAVENQATDRAYRIGQKKDVFVHLFISAGTLEEHVDELLTRKARVAGTVITEAEWLEAAKLDE